MEKVKEIKIEKSRDSLRAFEFFYQALSFHPDAGNPFVMSSLRNESEIISPNSPSPFMERGLGGEVNGQVIKDRFLEII